MDKFLIEENVHLMAIMKQSYRDFAGTEFNFSYKTASDLIKNLTELVEAPLSKEMKEAGHGAIMYDAWTSADIHYIGLFACYIRHLSLYENGSKNILQEPVIQLLSCAPMENRYDEGNEFLNEKDVQLASSFNAEKYAEHIMDIFQSLYDIDVKVWAVCAIADNTSTNHKLSRILGLKHIPCNNHLLHLDVKDWIKDDNDLKIVVDSVHQTMVEAKGSLKNMAIL